MRRLLWIIGFTVLTGLAAASIIAVIGTPVAPVSELERARKSEFTIVAQEQRTPFPDWSGGTLDGGTWSTQRLTGATTVVNFWASWCGPCAEEWPELLAGAERTDGVRFIGVNSSDSRSDAEDFLRSFGSTYPQLFDSDAAVMRALNSVPNGSLPMTVVVDPEGRVAAWKSGPLTTDQLDRAIAAVRTSA